MRISKAILLLVVFAFVASLGFATGGRETQEDAGPVEIDWFVNLGWFGAQFRPETPVGQALVEETGVIINFMNSAGQAERINTMIASGDLTDVITGPYWQPHIPQLEGAGLVVPLNEVMAETQPEWWASAPPDVKAWYTRPDGNIYGWPSAAWPAEDQERFNVTPAANAALVARADIMEELDIAPEDFLTQDGMVEALIKVRDSGYTYNGLSVAPFWLTTNGGFPGGFVWESLFAVPHEDPDGNYSDPRLHERYLEHILFLNRLAREGLISAENFTTDRGRTDERTISGRNFAMPVNMGDQRQPFTRLAESDPEAVYVPVGPVRSGDGTVPLLRRQAAVSGWLFNQIAATGDHIERVAGLFAFMASERGRYLLSYGIEGEHYVLEDDGVRVRWTDSYQQLLDDPDVNAPQVVGTQGLWLLSNNAFREATQPVDLTPAQQVPADIFEFYRQFSFDFDAFRNLGPFGGTDEAGIQAQINVFWEEQLPLMVLADSEAEAIEIYEAAVDRMVALGLEQVVAAQNENFQNNKDKLGLEFAWPLHQ